MNEIKQMLVTIKLEVEKQQKILEELCKLIKTSSGVNVNGLQPRMNRATPGPEVDTRNPMDDEIERLERFVHLCRDVQALKEEGVINLMCDSVVRLAVSSKS